VGEAMNFRLENTFSSRDSFNKFNINMMLLVFMFALCFIFFLWYVQAEIDQTTKLADSSTETRAWVLRNIVIFCTFLLSIAMWRTYRALHTFLGCKVSELRTYLLRLGSGDFEFYLPPLENNDSVLAWIADSQQNLAKLNAEQKRTEDALRESEARLTTILDGNKIQMWAFDGTRYTYTNKQWFDYTGQNPAELLTIERWVSVVHPDDVAKSTEVWLANWETKTEHDNHFRLLRHDGVYRDFYCHATPIFDTHGEFSCFQGFNVDVTDRKQAEDEIKFLAFYDPLTELANRRLMTDRMNQQLAFARRSGELLAICMIDLDGFKQVNDQLGHKAGDSLLIEVARRLKASLRESDTASRFGGDEFSLILGNFKKISECEQSLNRIIASLAEPYLVNGQVARVTASLGATLFPNDGATADLLLRHADQAMYEAKKNGKNCYCLFNPSQQNQELSAQAMLLKIGQALQNAQFSLFYQPQVDCKLGKIVGMEALIRWNHPVLGLLSPSEFIPLLEHDNLIIKLGEWVIQQALTQLTVWQREAFDCDISVNIAAKHLHEGDFVSRLSEILAEYPAEVRSRLRIEVVETAALEDINLVSETIKRCRELGVHFAIDDFGTGFSSLAHLKHLQVDELKIDKSFVMGMLSNPEDLAIVKGVIGLAASFKYRVIAEGVESIEHILLLKEMGCDLIQGFAISRPLPQTQVAEWLSKFQPDPLWKSAQ
jgi:diguanylate cyclase (GGDEF)-like protein/PAS domain S-box-containing protein